MPVGCTDINADNYDVNADQDDGSCTYDGSFNPNWETGADVPGEGTAGMFEELELDYGTIVEEFFPDQFHHEIAEDEEDWWEQYEMYFHEYDPWEEENRKRQRELDVVKWEEKMLKDKRTLEHAAGVGGFVTSGVSKEYEDTLTKLGRIEFLEDDLEMRSDIYNFQKEWQEEILDQVTEISQLGAFEEGDPESTDGNVCTSDDQCHYGQTCSCAYGMGIMKCCDTDAEGVVMGCTDPEADNYDQFANTDDGSCYGDDSDHNIEDGTCLDAQDSESCCEGAGGEWDFLSSTCEFDAFDDELEWNDGGTLNCESTDDSQVCCEQAGGTWYTNYCEWEDWEYDNDTYGCTDPTAENYDSGATLNDGSCWYNDGDGDGIPDDIRLGCTDPEAINWDEEANSDDGTCSYGALEDENVPGDPSLGEDFEIINCEAGGGYWWQCEGGPGCCGTSPAEGGDTCCPDLDADSDGDGIPDVEETCETDGMVTCNNGTCVEDSADCFENQSQEERCLNDGRVWCPAGTDAEGTCQETQEECTYDDCHYQHDNNKWDENNCLECGNDWGDVCGNVRCWPAGTIPYDGSCTIN